MCGGCLICVSLVLYRFTIYPFIPQETNVREQRRTHKAGSEQIATLLKTQQSSRKPVGTGGSAVARPTGLPTGPKPPSQISSRTTAHSVLTAKDVKTSGAQYCCRGLHAGHTSTGPAAGPAGTDVHGHTNAAGSPDNLYGERQTRG